MSVAQQTSASAIPISGAIGVIGCLWTVRSTTWAAIAMPAARNAIRMTLRTGNHACGESSRTHVNATSAAKATGLPGTVTSVAVVTAVAPRAAAVRGRHQDRPASNGVATVFTVVLLTASPATATSQAATGCTDRLRCARAAPR